MRPWIVLAIGAAAASLGCAEASEPARSPGPVVGATGVQLELAGPDGRIVVQAAALTAGALDGPLRFAGDASVTVSGGRRPGAVLEARSDQITVREAEGVAVLAGRVRARFQIPAWGRPDAGL